MLARVAILALFFGSSGCGILIQTIMGWHNPRIERRTEEHLVAVESDPADGVEVSRKDPGGTITELGPAPFTDTVTYESDVTIEEPSWGGLLVGGLIDTAVGIALTYAYLNNRSGTDDDGLIIYLLGPGVSEVITAIVWSQSTPGIGRRRHVPDSQWYTYIGRSPGLPDGTDTLHAPGQGSVQLVLGPRRLVDRNAIEEPVEEVKPPVKVEVMADDAWTVAVMNVVDLHADKKDQAIDKALIESLGDQLRIVIAQQGVRTIDRITQDRVLAEQTSAMQDDKMRACNDDSCQLELGRALAASHVVRARVARMGQVCAFVAELIDVRSEEVAGVSSLEGDCAAQGIFNMSEEAARALIKKK